MFPHLLTLNAAFNARGTASHPDNPSSSQSPEVLLCERKHREALGKVQDVQSWVEKHFAIYLFCHKYLCLSLCEGRKCQSEADGNTQTKGVTSGGFYETSVAKRRK